LHNNIDGKSHRMLLAQLEEEFPWNMLPDSFKSVLRTECCQGIEDESKKTECESMPIDDKFGAYLGKGSFGVVRKVVCADKSKQFAIKEIEAAKTGFDEQVESIKEEFEITKQSEPCCVDPDQCPSALELQLATEPSDDDEYSPQNSHWILLGFVPGWSMIAASKKPSPSIIAQLLWQLKCLHDLGIVHNDIKPQNILVSNDHATMVDFGVACNMYDAGCHHTPFAGTKEYTKFEIVNGEEISSIDTLSGDAFSLMFSLWQWTKLDFKARPPNTKNADGTEVISHAFCDTVFCAYETQLQRVLKSAGLDVICDSLKDVEKEVSDAICQLTKADADTCRDVVPTITEQCKERLPVPADVDDFDDGAELDQATHDESVSADEDSVSVDMDESSDDDEFLKKVDALLAQHKPT